jgi:sodium transport system permease protein
MKRASLTTRLDWHQVWILYRREMRAALREKTIVINSILIPVFLYPFLLWAALTALIFVMGQTEGFLARVVVNQWPAGHPGLRLKLEHDKHLQLLESKDSASALEQKIKNGELELSIQFLPVTGQGSSLPQNFKVQLLCNQSKERSIEAARHVTEVIEQYRATWLKREARRLGVNAAEWQGFTISTHNVASKKEMGAFVLGMLAPIIFVVMVAMGCFYPAVDAVAGERERNTWETLMSSAATRLSIVTAKYLYVVTFGGLAGMLNLIAVIATIRPIFGPLLNRAGHVFETSVPLAALPAAVLGAILLAGFVAAGMMIFASFARTFKEGQAMVTPFYMLILVPVVFLQAPGLTFSIPLALVPVINVTLVIRDAFSGRFQWTAMAVTVAASIALIALCLRLAAFIVQFEDVMLGSYSGSFIKFIRQRLLRRGPKCGACV